MERYVNEAAATSMKRTIRFTLLSSSLISTALIFGMVQQPGERTRGGQNIYNTQDAHDTDQDRRIYDLEEWKKRDSIARFRDYLIDEGIANLADTEKIQKTVETRIEEAVEFARQSPEPDLASLEEDIYA